MNTEKQKNKILYISTKSGFFGGVERYIYDTAALLSDNGYRVSGLFKEKAKDFELFSRPFDKIYDFTDVDKIIEENDFDLAFIHKVDDSKLIGKLRRKYKTAVFVHDHDYYCMRRHKYYPVCRTNCPLPFNLFYCSLCSGMIARGARGLQFVNPLRRRRLMNEIRQCDAFIVMSGFMQNNLIMNRFSINSIYKIYPLRKLPSGDALKKSKGEIPVIIYVGQLIYGKGVDLMLQALAQIDLDFRAIIVGSNKDDDFLKSLAGELGIADKVEFAGWQTDPAPYWKKADVAVFPSRWLEPFGLTGIEAFSFGIPVVGFDVGGVSEWLKNNVNGILVPAKDVDGMAAAVRRLISSPEIADQFGENGHNMVKNNFSPDNFLVSFKAMLDGITAGENTNV
ncbi:MAG: glycosyltransferase family 4 protein [Victivallaceae bacterium]